MNETINKDLGLVTAYAYAVAGGYTGTEEEFKQLMADLVDEVERLEDLSVTVTTLPEGSPATASLNGSVLSLGIPKGDTGAKGDTGNGVASIAKTSTSGLVDTYTITFTNGTTTTFTVTNGAKGDKGDPGDVSQAQLDAAVSDLKSEFNLFEGLSYTVVTGAYAGKNDGVITALGSYNVTDFIDISNYDVAVRTKVGDDISGTCFYDKDKNYISGYNAYSENEILTSISKPTDAVYIRVSCLASYSSKLEILLRDVAGTITNINSAIGALKSNNEIESLLTFTSNGYIGMRDGAVTQISNASFNYSDYVKVEYANKIIVTTAFIDLAGGAFYDKDKNFVSGVSSATGYNGEKYTYKFEVPTNAMYFRFTVYTRNMSIDESSLYLHVRIEDVINYIDEHDTNNVNGKQILSAFKNITFIGDSLTHSQVYTGASSSRQAFNPYPKVIEYITGVPATILAKSGDTAEQSWNRYNADIITKEGQLTVIYLGTNGGLTDTISTDMIGEDYTQWASTNTGGYGKLIAKSLAIGSRVVLVKVHSSSGDVSTTNSVIEQLATRFNVPYIENDYLSGNKYHAYPDGSGSNGTHYNDIGYTVFAQQVIEKISNLSDADIVKILPI